jgi:hypothetical protein
MTVTLLQQHWALAGAGIVAVAVLLFVAWRGWLDSARGRLRIARRRLRKKRAAAKRGARQFERATATLQSLQRNSESVKPRRLQEASEAVQDAGALLKIANDQVLIARNHVRKIIVEEFPPKHHDRMRRKYLPDERHDDKPFTF